MWWYHAYITSPTWYARRNRHRKRHPWCMAHGKPCPGRDVHHASYFFLNHFGREMPWELVALCRSAHSRISGWHRGWRVPNVVLFALTWTVIGWVRLAGLRGRR